MRNLLLDFYSKKIFTAKMELNEELLKMKVKQKFIVEATPDGGILGKIGAYCEKVFMKNIVPGIGEL